MKKEIANAKALEFDLVATANEAERLLDENDQKYKSLLVEICVAMQYVKYSDQDMGKMKKNLFRFFTDLKLYIEDVDKYQYKDLDIYDVVIDFIKNDMKRFLNNENNVDFQSDKLFKFLDKKIESGL